MNDEWWITIFFIVIGHTKCFCFSFSPASQIDFIIGREIEIGGVYKGIVTSIKEYGAFVEFNGGQQGLLHISELSHESVCNNMIKYSFRCLSFVSPYFPVDCIFLNISLSHMLTHTHTHITSLVLLPTHYLLWSRDF